MSMFRWLRRSKPTINPSEPHSFVTPSNNGVGTFAAGVSGNPDGPGFASAAMTGAYLRADHRCGLPGCGKSRDDDVHASD